MMPMLSFVVPVFNVAAFLQECVESLMAEDMSAAEIILVDDGSSDDSGKICDELVEKYACVRCMHKQNAGVAAARNDGLAAARGRYIAFVDADDRVADGGTQSILKWAENANADVCFLQAKKFYPDGASADQGDGITRSGIAGKDKAAVFRYLASRPKYPGSACTKVFKREFLQKKGLAFPGERKHGEDLTFVLNCLLQAESFDALDTPYYEYRQGRAGAATAAVTDASFKQLGMFVSEFADRLTANKKATDSIAESAMAFVAYEYAILLWEHAELPVREKEARFSWLKAYAWVLKFGNSRKIKTIRMIKSLTGLRATAFLLKQAMRLRKR